MHAGFWFGNVMKRELGRRLREWEDNIKMEQRNGVGYVD